MHLFPLPHPNLFLAFEILSFGTYLIVFAREVYQRNWRRVFELLSCTVFGMILEIGNIYLAHTYSYSSNFLIQILGVPLAIGFGWATIIYCAMLLSDQYRIPWTLRPFMDALTAIVLDLSMDAIAIRLGFWTWAIPYDQEWYGVPFENLAGWILVTVAFSFFARFLRTLNPKRRATLALMIFSPFIEYALLFIGLVVFSLLAILPHGINNWGTLLYFNYRPDFRILFNPEVQLWKLIILMAILTEVIHRVIMAIARYHRNYLWRFDLLSFSIMTSFHVFFFVLLFTSGIYQRLPYLVLRGGITMGLHLLLHFLPYLLRPKFVYIFRDFKDSVQAQEQRFHRFVQQVFQ